MLEELVLSGKLDIFNNLKWNNYWKSCKAKAVSIQNRLRTQGFINFMRSHAHNQYTTKLILKRDFTMNDLFYLFSYLLQNKTVTELDVAFMEATGKKPKLESQVLVPIDQMEYNNTTVVCKPLGIFSNNNTLKSIIMYKNSIEIEWIYGSRNVRLLN